MKLQLGLDKRAYMQIDFSFAVFIFFVFFLTIYSLYQALEGDLKDKIEIEKLQLDSRDICYVLTETAGSPDNWFDDISSSNFIGLKDSSNNTLNSSKILIFQNTSNYFTLIDSLNLSSFMKIDIIGLTSGTQHVSLGSSPILDSFSASYVCYSNYEGEQVTVEVTLWK